MKKRTLGFSMLVIGALWTSSFAIQDAPTMKRQEPTMKSVPMMKTSAPMMKKATPTVKKKRVAKKASKRKMLRKTR